MLTNWTNQRLRIIITNWPKSVVYDTVGSCEAGEFCCVIDTCNIGSMLTSRDHESPNHNEILVYELAQTLVASEVAPKSQMPIHSS